MLTLLAGPVTSGVFAGTVGGNLLNGFCDNNNPE